MTVCIALIVALVAPTWLEHHQIAVLAIGFAIGLPHGAVDHLVPFWTGRLRREPRVLIAVLAGYVGVAFVTLMLLRFAPNLVLPALLVASVLHFGAADRATDHDGPPPQARGGNWPAAWRTAEVVARGAPVLVGPLLAWPGPTQQALAVLAPGLAMSGGGVRVAVLAAFAGCVLITAIGTLRQRRPRPLLETGALLALFLAVPPLAAFGIYFGAWHGLRHTARLLVTEPRNAADLAQGRLLAPIGRFARAAAIPTVVADGTVAGLSWLVGQQHSLIGPVFSILFALTVPHLVVVALLDQTTTRRRAEPATDAESAPTL